MRTQNELDLLTACENGNLEQVRALLNRGVNPQFTFNEYPDEIWTDLNAYKVPISVATLPYSEKHLQVVKVLLDAGVDVDTRILCLGVGEFKTPLGEVLKHWQYSDSPCKIQEQMLELYLSRGAQLSQVSDDLIFHFVTRLNTSSQALELLLNAGLDVNKLFFGSSVLVKLVEKSKFSKPGDEQTKKIELLHTRGACLISSSFEKLRHAINKSSPHVFAFLVARYDLLLSNMSLHDTAIIRTPKFTQLLIARGDNINALNDAGYTPLMTAIVNRSTEAAFILMEAGADLNIREPGGKTALHLSVYYTESYYDEYLYYRCSRGLHLLQELYSRGATSILDNKMRTPLMCHEIKSYWDEITLEHLIGEFASMEAVHFNIDVNTYVAMLRAVYRTKDVSLINNLYAREDRTNKQLKHKLTRQGLVSTATKSLLFALECNNLTAVKTILSRYPEINLNEIINFEGRRPFSAVVRSVRHTNEYIIPLLGYLLSKGVDINKYDANSQRTFPLMTCFQGLYYAPDLNILLFMLEHGADCNLVDAQRNTALHHAAAKIKRRGSDYCILTLQAIDMLLENGADPDVLSFEGNKPIDLIPRSDVKARAVFAKYQPHKNNLIDQALFYACSAKNIDSIVIELQRGYCYFVDKYTQEKITLEMILESISKRPDLTAYAKNRLALLNAKSNNDTYPVIKFTRADLNSLKSLMSSLYNADLDLIQSISQDSANGAYQDLENMRKAAKRIQFWARKITNFATTETINNSQEVCDSRNLLTR